MKIIRVEFTVSDDECGDSKSVARCFDLGSAEYVQRMELEFDGFCETLDNISGESWADEEDTRPDYGKLWTLAKASRRLMHTYKSYDEGSDLILEAEEELMNLIKKYGMEEATREG